MAVGGASSPMPQANAAWATPEAAKWLEHRRHLQSSVGGRPKKHEVKSAQRPDAGAEGRNEEALAAREALQRFRRPHVLHADVGELTLHLALLDLKLAWSRVQAMERAQKKPELQAENAQNMQHVLFETVRYFVSFHPSSVRLPTVQLPKETPRPTSPDATNTKYMASPALAPSPKQTSETVVYDWQESVRFDEHMQMLSDHLDSHFLLFLWCSKSSLLSESTVLLGYRPLPLREPELYARWATWDILDLNTSEELAQLSLRLDVTAPPNQIRLPHLSDVSNTGFTLNWSEPLGSSASAYAVSVQPSDGAAAVSRQFTTGHSAALSGLQPDATYVVDVRGMNQAGWGDSCKLEASTAPRRQETDDQRVRVTTL
ncbi:unnamed protein product [Cladocopium goreaui]|uniref:1,3-beta-glucanosyltransferase gel1 n=1 Tax=Cladocopium goreaui TaxID=2562237 RepID=A0A9P1BU79_9DINO|nr:unnamed protein product [Cladocopium goreaui]